MHQHDMNILPHPSKMTVIPLIAIIFCDAYYIQMTVGHDAALPSMTRAAILHHEIGAIMTPLPHACYYHVSIYHVNFSHVKLYKHATQLKHR
jgi:hypothetical protein